MDKRPATIETVRSVTKTGPVRVRFAEDSKTWMLDSFTASAMVAVYDALSAENQAKIGAMIGTKKGMMRFVNFCWKHVRAA